MVALAVADVLAKHLRATYYVPIIVGLVSLIILKTWSSGRRTTRERDLHGRTVLITGASSALGITLMAELAKRGAQVIGIVPDLIDPSVLSIIDAIRHTTNNELVYAEECDLYSPQSIQEFFKKFVKASGGGLESEPPRLDAVIFAHEYSHIGAFRGTKKEKELEISHRGSLTLSTFFIITLLLPVLLTAPKERDIRFISVVSPFYAAAIPSFKPKSGLTPSSPINSIWVQEGQRSLRSILFIRHFQRILDALPSSSDPSNVIPQDGSSNDSKPPSNIIACTVSPGISRSDTVAPFLRADRNSLFFSLTGLLCYFLILPLLIFMTKGADDAVQSILHALFLPTKMKASSLSADDQQALASGSKRVSPFLKGGAVYSDCEVVDLPGGAELSLGGEEVGLTIWETLEKNLAEWRSNDPPKGTATGSTGTKKA